MKPVLGQIARIIVALTLATVVVELASAAAPLMESVSSEVRTGDWSTVQLNNSYPYPIVVCTPIYEPTAPPAVIRVRNATSRSFQIRLDRLDGKNVPHRATANCIVVQKGAYNIRDHGINMEAHAFFSRRTDRAGDLVGTRRALLGRYRTLVVLGQVMTTNDDRFSLFWSKPSLDSANWQSPKFFYAGNHIGKDPSIDRRLELIGYIAIDAGSGQIGSLNYEARVGPQVAPGPKVTRYQLESVAAPTSAILNSWSVRTTSGGFPVIAGTKALTGSSLSFFIDGYQTADPERNQISESVAYLAIRSRSAASPSPDPIPPGGMSIRLSPPSAQLSTSQSTTFTVISTGGDPGQLRWSLNPQLGSLAISGGNAVYVAPQTVAAKTNVTITAQSSTYPTELTANAVITILPFVSVDVAPRSVTVLAGQQAQFTASVSGAPSQSVTWSLRPPTGTISNTGLYYAPASVNGVSRVQVIAQSLENPTTTGTAEINLQPPPRGVEFQINDSKLTQLAYRGVSFYAPHNHIMRGAFFRAKDGSLADVGSSGGWIHPNVTSRGPDWFEHIYNPGANHEFAVRVQWQIVDRDTLRAIATVSNRDLDEDLTRIDLLFLPFQIPGPAREYNQNIPITVGASDGPLGFLSGDWGSVAFWHEQYPSALQLHTFYGSPSQKTFDVTLRNYSRLGPDHVLEDVISPQSSRQFVYNLRFSDKPQLRNDVAPEAYQAFRRGYPSLLDWPDRRPIATWFVAEGTKRSAANPRGYLWDPAIDIGSPSFRSKILAKTDEMIARMNSLSPRPQGIVIWDLEGQEFDHAFTYIGAPDKLSALAPEMDAVADEIFGRFRAAGYRTGLTVRPQDFGSGPLLPSTCNSYGYPWSSDKFIKTNAPFPYRAYRCVDPGTWEVTSHGPGAQKGFRSREEVIAVLERKIEYAVGRWGIEIFYVDSSAYDGAGAFDFLLWRALSERFPNVLFIPEIETTATYGSTAPYNEGRMNVFFANSNALQVYPKAFSVLSIADIDHHKYWDVLVASLKAGNVFLVPMWWEDPLISIVQQLYRDSSR